MRTWTKVITVTSHRKLHYHYKCLYCGKENDGVLERSRTLSEKYTVSCRANEAPFLFSAREAMLSDKINAELGDWESSSRKQAVKFAEYWIKCSGGNEQPPLSPLYCGTFRCSYCKTAQPYSTGKYHAGIGRQVKPVIFIISGILLFLAGIVFFSICPGEKAGLVQRIISLSAAALGMITTVIASMSIGKTTESTPEEEAILQHQDLKHLPYDPDRMMTFSL